MQKRFKVGEVEIIHFYMPGKYLNDSSLKKLHNRLIQIGDESKTINVNKLLNKNLTIEEIREHLKNTIIALGMFNKAPYGFLLHPITNDKEQTMIETDLFVISRNVGTGFNKMMIYGNLIMLYERVGGFVSSGRFDLEDGNIGKVNLYKNLLITLQFYFVKKGLMKVAAARDAECETIRQIIANMNTVGEEKCLRY